MIDWNDVSGYCKDFLEGEARLTDEEFEEYVIDEFMDIEIEDKIKMIKELESTDYEENINKRLKFLIRQMGRDDQVICCTKHL